MKMRIEEALLRREDAFCLSYSSTKKATNALTLRRQNYKLYIYNPN